MSDYAELKARLAAPLYQWPGEKTEIGMEAAAAIDALERERDKDGEEILYLRSELDAAEARVKRLEGDLDRFAHANHRQAFCIHATASALGPDYAATIDALPKEARHVRTRAETAEARVKRLEGAIKARIHYLDEETGQHCDCGACLALLAALQEDKNHE